MSAGVSAWAAKCALSSPLAACVAALVARDGRAVLSAGSTGRGSALGDGVDGAGGGGSLFVVAGMTALGGAGAAWTGMEVVVASVAVGVGFVAAFAPGVASARSTRAGDVGVGVVSVVVIAVVAGDTVANGCCVRVS